MQQHYVEFLSPGTFVAETSRRELDAWDIDAAVDMAASIEERHGATPYGFQFLTRSRGEHDLDAKETARSGIYYLGGDVRTIDDVRRDANPREAILLQNMESNKWDRIITTESGWTQPLKANDVVLTPVAD